MNLNYNKTYLIKEQKTRLTFQEGGDDDDDDDVFNFVHTFRHKTFRNLHEIRYIFYS